MSSELETVEAPLTAEQAAHLAALERIDVCAREWHDALVAAVDCGCAEEAIRNRVLSLVGDVFGVGPEMLNTIAGML